MVYGLATTPGPEWLKEIVPILGESTQCTEVSMNEYRDSLSGPVPEPVMLALVVQRYVRFSVCCLLFSSTRCQCIPQLRGQGQLQRQNQQISQLHHQERRYYKVLQHITHSKLKLSHSHSLFLCSELRRKKTFGRRDC